jgi:Transposase protein
LLHGPLRSRQITWRSPNGHQTPTLTSRRDLPTAEAACRMFERWRQESFFKYLGDEYALDALADYAVVPDNPDRDVPNPKRPAIIAQLQDARTRFDALTADYGAVAFVNQERARPSIRSSKIAHGPLASRLRAAFTLITGLEQARTAMPARVPIQAVVGDHVVKLPKKRQWLTNLIKMVAHQAESDLVQAVTRHQKRASDEARALIQSAFMSAADLEVCRDELRLPLAGLSPAHRTRAIAARCDELNTRQTRFPGSRLCLRNAVETACPSEWTIS